MTPAQKAAETRRARTVHPAAGGKVARFDRAAAKAVGSRVPALLQALADEIGATVSYGGGSFDEGEFTCRVRFKLREVGGVNADQAAFCKSCGVFNLRPEDFDARIVTPRGEARIVGLAPGRSKRPIVIEYLAKPGKRWVIEDGFVRRQLGREFDWEKPAPTEAA